MQKNPSNSKGWKIVTIARRVAGVGAHGGYQLIDPSGRVVATIDGWEDKNGRLIAILTGTPNKPNKPRHPTVVDEHSVITGSRREVPLKGRSALDVWHDFTESARKHSGKHNYEAFPTGPTRVLATGEEAEIPISERTYNSWNLFDTIAKENGFEPKDIAPRLDAIMQTPGHNEELLPQVPANPKASRRKTQSPQRQAPNKPTNLTPSRRKLSPGDSEKNLQPPDTPQPRSRRLASFTRAMGRRPVGLEAVLLKRAEALTRAEFELMRRALVTMPAHEPSTRALSERFTAIAERNALGGAGFALTRSRPVTAEGNDLAKAARSLAGTVAHAAGVAGEDKAVKALQAAVNGLNARARVRTDDAPFSPMANPEGPVDDVAGILQPLKVDGIGGPKTQTAARQGLAAFGERAMDEAFTEKLDLFTAQSEADLRTLRQMAPGAQVEEDDDTFNDPLAGFLG